MYARDFYECSSMAGVPLTLLTKNQALAKFPELSGDIRAQLLVQHFQGELGDVAVIGDGAGQINRVFIGQSTRSDATALAHAMTRIPQGLCYQLTQTVSTRAAVMWSLAQYRYDEFKPREKALFRQLCIEANTQSEVLIEADAVFFVRDLINKPANILGPVAMSQVLSDMAEQFGAQFEQCVGDELLHDNYPAIHAVGRAAVEAPRLLRLTWGNPAYPRVVLIGKGVCFDTGGLDIKPSSGMRLMKKDMGGAAIVMGLAKWIMQIGLPIYLEVLIPAVENALGPNAYRPSDILTMRNGLTVEIENTDAEGRLVLADALVRACETPLDLLIDASTLTGAARVAVGTEISAFFTPNDAIAEALQVSSQQTGDALWRLPLHADYASMLDSSVANLMNSSPSSYAGAIVAALFLQRFVAMGLNWIHIDTMAWNVNNKPGRPEGGEAMGLQAMAAFLSERYR